MHRTWLVSACALGFVAVGGGAFGAHALAGRMPPDLLQVFETGATYARFAVVGLLAAAAVAGRSPSKAAGLSGALFVAGAALFTGSLWAMALTGYRWLGAVTPFGGLAFLGAWAALGVAGFRGRGAR